MSVQSVILRIDADQRSSGDSSQFSIDLGQQRKLTQCYKIAVKSIQITNVFYNIRTGINDIFAIDVSGIGDVSVTLPQGFYSYTELSTDLTTLLDAALAIADPGNSVTFSLGVDGLISVTTATSEFKIPDVSGTMTMDTILGFDTASSAYASTQTANTVPKLGGLSQALVQCQQVAEGNGCSGGGEILSLLAAVPIDSEFGAQTIYRSYHEDLDSISYSTPRNIQIMNFRITDRNDQLLDLQGTNTKIVLKCYLQA